MEHKMVDMVVTGADRIAANGDTANKIGTYTLSVLAKAHSIPMYVVAPSSTFDMEIASGAEIPIEQRAADELRSFGNRQIVPDNADVYNPAFDVTPAANITAIVTQKGIIEKPDKTRIAQHLGL
jgi:methylthioribose-1-phosphate isomerase